jgi:hypothetical protein
MEEMFLRNFFQYFEEYRRAKQQPSPFQLLLFLYKQLAIPCPGPAWLGLWLSLLFVYVRGFIIGEWLLGYKKTYSEYYQSQKEKQEAGMHPWCQVSPRSRQISYCST